MLYIFARVSAALKLKVNDYYRNGLRATAILIAIRDQLAALDQIGTLTRAISLSQKEVKLEPREHEKFSRCLRF